MQSEERELITGLFARLQPFESQARDSEAEAMIKESVARQPAAPYLLVQTVLVQEQALKAAQERIAELEAKASGAPAVSGFLGSAPKIGPWGAPAGAAAPAPDAPRPSLPSTRSPLEGGVRPQQAPHIDSELRHQLRNHRQTGNNLLAREWKHSMPLGVLCDVPGRLFPSGTEQHEAIVGG